MMSRQLLGHIALLVERHAARNALLRVAEEGEVTRAALACYLYNTAYFVLNTQIQVELGTFRTRAADQPDLLHCVLDKKREEGGHHEWAIHDLERLKCSSAEIWSCAVHPSLRDMFRYIHEQFDGDPSYYVIYNLFADYLNQCLAPRFVRMLVERCGVARNHLSLLTHHAELDLGHVEEDCQMIDLLEARGALPPFGAVRAFLDRLDWYFHAFCGAIAEHSTGDGQPN